jgi:DNA-directed RNA polymerase subunit RPC12/RpoP
MKKKSIRKKKTNQKQKIVCGEATMPVTPLCLVVAGERSLILHPLMASRGHHINPGGNMISGPYGGHGGMIHDFLSNGQSSNGSSGNNGSSSRRDHNIDYSALFVQLAGTFPTLYRCVSCHKTVSNRWHHANIHRPQKHECPVCHQVFTRRDNMKAHCKVKHADRKDIFYGHLVHM